MCILSRLEPHALLTIGIGVLFLVPAQCFENLARRVDFHGTPTQSRSYPYPLSQAEAAIDGSLDTPGVAQTSFDHCSFTVAYAGYTTAWWKLPLKKMANVAYLLIHFRGDTINRHIGFKVYAFNDSSFIPPSPGGEVAFSHNTSLCIDPVTNATINRVTQGIALYRTQMPTLQSSCHGFDPTITTIETCEIIIMGCEDYHYGESCKPCSSNCRNSQCDAFDGSCIYGCEHDLMIAPGCTVCEGRLYGENCSESCAHCFNGSKCNMTGICTDGCEYNWDGPKCDECQDGLYGPNCSEPCGHCAPGTVCDKETGRCPKGCETNWAGCKCNDCGLHKYGSNCSLDCGQCKDDLPCSTGNGTCLNGCEEGWEGITCSKELPKSDGPGVTNADKSPATGLYVATGVLTTIFAVVVLMNVILFYNLRTRTRTKLGSTRR